MKPRTIIVSLATETLRRLSIGFRRTGSNLYATNADTIHVINFQSSPESRANVVIVTVNIGVYSIPLAEKLGEKKSRPSVWDCHWNIRIGHLMSNKCDKWWRITNENEVSSLAEEISGIIERRIVPTLNGLLTTKSLMEYWRSGGYGGLGDLERQDYLTALEG